MSVAERNRVSVQGQVASGFENVRDAFVESFARRRELGGACCAYLGGERVVDLWGGVRTKRTGEARPYCAMLRGVCMRALAWRVVRGRFRSLARMTFS